SHNKLVQQCIETLGHVPTFELAGPREKLFFDPAKLNCGIVTCGGLCPGLNDVIRTITLTLAWQYKVKTIFGFRYGYAGLSSNALKDPIILTPEIVDEIHTKGGSILASSRGPQEVDDMIDHLVKRDIGLLFVIGGDGTLRGAGALAEGIKARGLSIGVVGIPKTIDNDITGIEQSFGFSTAVEEARAAIMGAHEEAKGAFNGVGMVKLMGRDSGFIAAAATLSNSDVNFCFIPEVPLTLDGENGFLRKLEQRLDNKHHAVIVVAEGVQLAGRDPDDCPKDASGNVILEDVGLLLKTKIQAHFKQANKPLALKYIAPSYIIRSVPANSQDSLLCLALGQSAVHAGGAQNQNMVIGFWNQHCTHIPIALAALKRKKVDPKGYLWQTVLGTTGQEGY
ncbi:MAG: ATP-dependent 6-phosphofructokinase, partial [Phycisphaerae bacterium]|nr:ATP-dependent 6-phosphofructokinase [Phycisphaerae bacterium]